LHGTIFILSGIALMYSERICISSALIIRSGRACMYSEGEFTSRHYTALIPAAFLATVRVSLTEPIAAYSAAIPAYLISITPSGYFYSSPLQAEQTQIPPRRPPRGTQPAACRTI